MADRPPNAWLVYNVTSPLGEKFRAAVVGGGTGMRAVSNRSGEWADEPAFEAVDLMRPEYKLQDWDIQQDDEGADEEVQPDGKPSFLYRLNKAEAKLNAKEQVKDLSDHYPEVGEVSVEVQDLGDSTFATAGAGKIILNERQWQPKKLAERERVWKGLVIDSSPEGTLLHEFGHLLIEALRAKHGSKVDAIVDRYRGSTPTSPYSMDSKRQFEAESFVAFHTRHVVGAGPGAANALASAEAMWEELLAL